LTVDRDFWTEAEEQRLIADLLRMSADAGLRASLLSGSFAISGEKCLRLRYVALSNDLAMCCRSLIHDSTPSQSSSPDWLDRAPLTPKSSVVSTSDAEDCDQRRLTPRAGERIVTRHKPRAKPSRLRGSRVAWGACSGVAARFPAFVRNAASRMSRPQLSFSPPYQSSRAAAANRSSSFLVPLVHPEVCAWSIEAARTTPGERWFFTVRAPERCQHT